MSDCVVHLAALDFDTHSASHDYMRVNVLGTWNVLEACAAASVRQVVVCSSIAAVGLDELRSDWTPDGSAGPIPATARMSGPSRAAGASA